MLELPRAATAVTQDEDSSPARSNRCGHGAHATTVLGGATCTRVDLAAVSADAWSGAVGCRGEQLIEAGSNACGNVDALSIEQPLNL